MACFHDAVSLGSRRQRNNRAVVLRIAAADRGERSPTFGRARLLPLDDASNAVREDNLHMGSMADDGCEGTLEPVQFWSDSLERLQEKLKQETGDRRRAQCMAHIQGHAVQLALDLIVREADIEGFFAAFMKSLIEMGESQACAVWLLDEEGTRCDLWMAYVGET